MTMLLHELSKSQGLNRKAKRRGRGDSSGKGNYSGRGQKGQGSRSGGKMPAWFEGGQTPLNLRLPKLKGFKRYYKLVDNYQIVNLDSLEKDNRISANSTISKQLLKELNYINKVDGLVKVLGRGEFNKILNFQGLDMFSNSAKAKIEKLGGKIE